MSYHARRAVASLSRSRYAFRDPDGRLSSSGQAWVTLFSMSLCAAIGFYVQQRMINNYYVGEQAELNRKVAEIKRLEMLELRLAGERAEAAERKPPSS